VNESCHTYKRSMRFPVCLYVYIYICKYIYIHKPKNVYRQAKKWMSHVTNDRRDFLCLNMCNMTHSHVRHKSFIFVTWFVHMYDLPHTSFICVTKRIRERDMIGWLVRYNSFRIWEMTHWTHYNSLQRAATNCNTLQHTATHCNTLQHAAKSCNML